MIIEGIRYNQVNDSFEFDFKDDKKDDLKKCF